MTKKKVWTRAARFAAKRSKKLPASEPQSRSASSSASLKPSASAKPSGVGATTDPSTTYEAYGQFIREELATQDARKASFEQRGVAVITTSGTLATLLLGLAALSTNASATFVLPQEARPWVTGALFGFFASAPAPLVVNVPLSYQAATIEEMRGRLREDPPIDHPAATKDIAFTRLKALSSAKRMNSIKGWALAVAIGLEALAVGSLAMAVSRIF